MYHDCLKKKNSAKLPQISLGALAQLVERNNGIVEVVGSIPIRSKIFLEFSLPPVVFQ